MQLPNTLLNNTIADASEVMANFNALLDAINTGWASVSDTWTYLSASSITVPSGAASLYQIGDKIKLTNSTVKYLSVTNVTDTVLSVTGGSDYTLTAGAISSIYVSKIENPLGFPGYFNFNPSRAVSGGTAPTYTAIDISHFRVSGSIVEGNISWVNLAGGTAGAGTGNLTFNLPVSCKSADFSGDRNHLGNGNVFESAGTICGANIVGNVSAAVAEFLNVGSGAAILGNDQSSTNRFINATFRYRIA